MTNGALNERGGRAAADGLAERGGRGGGRAPKPYQLIPHTTLWSTHSHALVPPLRACAAAAGTDGSGTHRGHGLVFVSLSLRAAAQLLPDRLQGVEVAANYQSCCCDSFHCWRASTAERFSNLLTPAPFAFPTSTPSARTFSSVFLRVGQRAAGAGTLFNRRAFAAGLGRRGTSARRSREQAGAWWQPRGRHDGRTGRRCSGRRGGL